MTVAIAFAIIVGDVCQHLNRGKIAGDSEVQVDDGVQMVYSTLRPGQYPTITVQAGIPVRWTIDAPEGSINGCNYKMIIQKYSMEYTFQEGENIIEFTPTETGTISYTCWMGMIRGSIIVTEENDTNSGSSDSASEDSNDDSAISDNAQVITKGEFLVIPTAEITETAIFYPITVDGTSMEVFVIKASDGIIRTAFNTCQMCYTSGKGFYIQEGKYLVCQNCGSRFTADDVEVVTGGCNPLPILVADKTVTSDSISISYDVLKEHCDYFKYWK